MNPEVERALSILKNHPDLKDDEQQREIIVEMERDVELLRVTKEFANSDVVRRQIEMFRNKIDNINVRLMTERGLKDDERAKLFNDKDMLQIYIKMNSYEDIEKKEQQLHEEIIREAQNT